MPEDRETGKAAGIEIQLVTFKLGTEEYAVDILSVQEIIRMTDITKVPRSQTFVEGIINLRGVVIPVIDLRARFGMKRTPVTGKTRIIVVNLDDLVIGFIVDQVQEVLRLGMDMVDAAPDIVRERIKGDFIKGVGRHGERLLILLDTAKILAQDEKNRIVAENTGNRDAA